MAGRANQSPEENGGSPSQSYYGKNPFEEADDQILEENGGSSSQSYHGNNPFVEADDQTLEENEGSPSHSYSGKNPFEETDEVSLNDLSLGSAGTSEAGIAPSTSWFDSESEASTPSKTRYLFPKYDTVQRLHPEQVRWFYQETRGKKWLPFSGYDSLRLECKYREILQRRGADFVNNYDARTNDVKDEDTELDRELIVVREELYEVSILQRKCLPIYWTPEGYTHKVTRGSWFFENSWQPLDETYANHIELMHLTKFEGMSLTESVSTENTKGPTPVLHQVRFRDFHVDWNAVNKVFLHSESRSSKLYRAVGTKLGLSKSGVRLCRGYCTEAVMDDKPADITHVVFVIHGVGQKMDTGAIIKSCSGMRESVRKVYDKRFLDLALDNKRAEFLPVEWRSTLKLDGGTVSSVTPNKINKLRGLLNISAMDILYYTSPLYQAEITSALLSELTRLYAMFCSRHPYFEASQGRVSVVAHSLGGVILYDVLTGWTPARLYDQYTANMLELHCGKSEVSMELVDQLKEARDRVTQIENQILERGGEQASSPSLPFKLENYFLLGSPLAVFLAMRGLRPQPNGSQEDILPKSLCNRIFNIYHPSDPVAYRLEPLVIRHYETLMPLTIHRIDASSRPPYQSITPVAYSALSSKASTSDRSDLKSSESGRLKGKVWSSMFRRNKKDQGAMSSQMTVLNTYERIPTADDAADDDEWTNLEIRVDRHNGKDEYPELEYRLDYQLREGKMENAYLSVLYSHTSYWANPDVAQFLLTNIFPGYG